MRSLKKVILVFIIAGVFLLSSCSRHTPDTNGPENLSLETITIDDILKTKSKSVRSRTLEINRGHKHSLKTRKFSGIETLRKFNLNGSAFHLSINAEVYSGNFRIVLCNKDKVLKDVRVNGGPQSFMLPPVSDTIYLKIAGESANFNLVYEYKIDMPENTII